MTDGLPQNIFDAARTLWSFHRVDDEPAQADIIIGLGSYDLRVAGRCADLYRTGYASRILFTGGSGNWTRDVFERPEADIFADVAVDAGVPPRANQPLQLAADGVVGLALEPDGRRQVDPADDRGGGSGEERRGGQGQARADARRHA